MHDYSWDFNISLSVTISLQEISKTICQMDLTDLYPTTKYMLFKKTWGIHQDRSYTGHKNTSS